MPAVLTRENFSILMVKTKSLALVQFKTEWSGACQIIDPIFRELVKTYRGIVDFYVIDADNDKILYDQYRIMELPTILFFYDGEVMDYAAGLTSKNKLIAKIENALSTINEL